MDVDNKAKAPLSRNEIQAGLQTRFPGASKTDLTSTTQSLSHKIGTHIAIGYDPAVVRANPDGTFEVKVFTLENEDIDEGDES